MKHLKKIYQFLGSIHFAVTLIALAALFIVAGTWIEALTHSHRSAVNLIYQNPVFKLLLICFFINILVSALNRFPFRFRHIPFLITHLGLLMIIAGIFVKNSYGVQGSIELSEGSGSHQLIFPEVPVIHVETRAGIGQSFEIQPNSYGKIALKTLEESAIPEIQLELLGYSPHSGEKIRTWILDHQGIIAGLKPFLVQDWNPEAETLPFSMQVRLHHPKSTPWHIYAFRTPHVDRLAQAIYVQSMEIAFSDSSNDQLLHHCSLKEALEHPIHWKNGSAATQLEFNLKSDLTFQSPFLMATGIQDTTPFKIQTDLDGKKALLNQNKLSPQLGMGKVAIDLVCSPSLAFIEDEKGNVHLFAFDSSGEVYSQKFQNSGLEKMIVYDQGFGGYFAAASIPFSHLPNMRKEREAAHLQQLALQLRQTLRKNTLLPPPLKLFAEACAKAKADFTANLLIFLDEWQKTGQWLFVQRELSPELLPILQALDWNSCPDFKACYWLNTLYEEITSSVDLAAFLKEKGLSNLSESKNMPQFMEELTHSLSTLEHELPEVNPSYLQKPASAAALLSAYFRLYAIHLMTLQNNFETDSDATLFYFATHLLANHLEEAFAPLSNLSTQDYRDLISQLPENSKTLEDLLKHSQPLAKLLFKNNGLTLTKPQLIEMISLTLPLPVLHQHYHNERILADLETSLPIMLESPITFAHYSLPASSKLEENVPFIKLKVRDSTREEIKTLRFQPHSAGLKHPVLAGDYRMRLQPKTEEIPYHVRLRNARQISYAHSNQAYSFESDIIVLDRRNKTEKETTLSMNHVYETWDGYRFYLANMTPATSTAAKHVQIVVNYDPAKYLLTYPGAAILSLGILLLFWFNPYKKEKSSQSK